VLCSNSSTPSARRRVRSRSTTQVAKRLAQLATDRPAADDDQVVGLVDQVEHRLVGQIGDLVEAGYRRHEGTRAGRHDEALGPDTDRPRLDLVGCDETGHGLDHTHAQTLETLDGIVRCDGCDHSRHMIVDGPEVDPRCV
jgi:hypothetical protein